MSIGSLEHGFPASLWLATKENGSRFGVVNLYLLIFIELKVISAASFLCCILIGMCLTKEIQLGFISTSKVIYGGKISYLIDIDTHLVFPFGILGIRSVLT